MAGGGGSRGASSSGAGGGGSGEPGSRKSLAQRAQRSIGLVVSTVSGTS
jgi:hypothetical protein